MTDKNDPPERPSDDLIIEHADGRSYGVTRKAFHSLYEDEGFKIVGKETSASFEPVGIPKQKAPRRRVRAKSATPKRPATVTPVAPVETFDAVATPSVEPV